MARKTSPRCLLCSRFVRRGVARCAKCDARVRADVAGRALARRTADSAPFAATFAPPSAAYLRAARWAKFLGLGALAMALVTCGGAL